MPSTFLYLLFGVIFIEFSLRSFIEKNFTQNENMELFRKNMAYLDFWLYLFIFSSL